MPRPVHFEIPTDNPDRAIAFYAAVFGWTFQKWEGPMPYWLITTGPERRARYQRRPAAPPRSRAALRQYHERAPTWMPPRPPSKPTAGRAVVPKMPVPDVGWLAYFKDLDGHIFGVMRRWMQAAKGEEEEKGDSAR